MSSSSVSTRSTSQFSSQFFEQSSQAWRANKRNVGQGYFRYARNAFPSPAADVVPLRRSTRNVDLESTNVSVSVSVSVAPVLRRSARLAQLDAKKPSASASQVYVAPTGTRHSARIAAKYQ